MIYSWYFGIAAVICYGIVFAIAAAHIHRQRSARRRDESLRGRYPDRGARPPGTAAPRGGIDPVAGIRRTVSAPPPVPPPGPSWAQARTRFDALRLEYADHECDPMAVLRLPALSDVSVPSTGRFVDAFAQAQALETDAAPPPRHAAAFVAAVDRAERAWQAARDAAERIRYSTLTVEERGRVERVIKLLTTARDSDSDAERLAAYAMARSELGKLERAGVIHMPRTARAALDSDGRGQLPS